MSYKRNMVGKGLYALTIAATLILIFIIVTSSGTGPAAVAAFGFIVLVGLICIASLAFITLIVGWRVKFIRLSLLSLAGLVALTFPASMLLERIGEYNHSKHQEARAQNQQVFDRIYAEYKSQVFTHRFEPEKVFALLDDMDAKLRSDCNLEKICLSHFKYARLQGDALLHLGIFSDPKYLEMLKDSSGYANFFARFFTENEAAFTQELHFIRLFKVMHSWTYDYRSNSAEGLNHRDEAQFARVLAQNGYAEAYKHFIPLTVAHFYLEQQPAIEVLKGALRLENELEARDLVSAAIAHTRYHYFADGYDCELAKFDQTFHVLKNSEHADEHIDQLFSQMPKQCEIRGWDTAYSIDEAVYCSLQETPHWLSMYMADGKLRENIYKHIDCSAQQ